MAGQTVVVSILADNKGLTKGLSSASSSLAGFGSKLAGAGAAVAKMAAAATVAGAVVATAIGVKAVKSASQLEQNMGALDAVFKGSAQQMEDWSKGAANALGLAQSEYAGLAVILGSQLKNMGVAADQVAGQTNDLITIGADLAAQFGGSTSEAVEALSSLLRGERDPIERYGVSINEAAVKAEMAAMGLSGLTGEAEKNAKLQATLALLTRQTADAQGAFARESTTLAGAQQRLAANTENLFGVLGTALLPAVTAVTAGLGKMVSTIADSAVFKTLIAFLASASNQFADFVFGVINGERTLSSLKFDFSDINFSAAIESFNSFRNAVISQAPQIISGLIAGLASGATAVAAVAGDILTALINGIIAALPVLFEAALAIIQGLVQGLTQALPGLLLAIAELIPTVIGQLLLAIPDLIIAAQDLFESLVVGLAQAIPALIQGLVDMWATVLPEIMAAYPAVLANGIEVFLAIVTAVAEALPQIVDAVTQAWPSILDAITAALPQILEAGKTAFLGLVQSIGQALPSIITAVTMMTPRFVSALVQMTPAILRAGLELFRALVQALPVVIPEVARGLRDMGPELTRAVLSIGPALFAAGGEIISGLVRGLQSSAGRVVSALTSIAGGAVNAFKRMLGIASPSKVFKGFGVNVVQGLAGGINASGRLLDQAMSGLNARVQGGFETTLAVPVGYGGGRYGAAPPQQIINVTFTSTFAPTAEDGRRAVEAIEEHIRTGATVRFA